MSILIKQSLPLGANWFGLIWNHDIAKFGYETVSQSGLNGRTAWAPRAKVVGGCTAHNAYVFIRGSKMSYDEWGNGWSWDVLKPHWQAILDNFNPTTNDGSKPYPTANQEYIDTMLAACQELGFTVNNDLNTMDGVHKGCNLRQHMGVVDTDSQGNTFIRRQTAYSQLVQPIVKDRPNLHVMVNQQVAKVVFKGKKAVGVRGIDPWSETSFEFKAKKEVILAAGVYDTPKLLLLSGIGPKEHLQEMGISVVHELNGVGENLLDDSFSSIEGPALKEQPEEWNSIWPVNGIQTWGEPGDDDDSTPPLFNWNYHIEPSFIDDKVRKFSPFSFKIAHNSTIGLT